MRQVRADAAAEMQFRSFADTWNCIAGSFAISEDTKPRVINLDFPPLFSNGDRTQKLIENGVKVTVRLSSLQADIHSRRLPCLCP